MYIHTLFLSCDTFNTISATPLRPFHPYHIVHIFIIRYRLPVPMLRQRTYKTRVAVYSVEADVKKSSVHRTYFYTQRKKNLLESFQEKTLLNAILLQKNWISPQKSARLIFITLNIFQSCNLKDYFFILWLDGDILVNKNNLKKNY